MSVIDIRIEHLDDPIGIGTATPRLSWRLTEGTQLAYEIEANRSGTVNTVRVDSDDVLLQDWPFAPLVSREAADVRVRALLDGESEFGAWSEPLRVEAGLLEGSDWQVDWISPSVSEATQHGGRPAHLLRAEFAVEGVIRRARLYATAHGIYDVELNGSAPNDEQIGRASCRERVF